MPVRITSNKRMGLGQHADAAWCNCLFPPLRFRICAALFLCCQDSQSQLHSQQYSNLHAPFWRHGDAVGQTRG